MVRDASGLTTRCLHAPPRVHLGEVRFEDAIGIEWNSISKNDEFAIPFGIANGTGTSHSMASRI